MAAAPARAAAINGPDARRSRCIEKGIINAVLSKNDTAPQTNRHDWYGIKTKPGGEPSTPERDPPRVG